VHTVCSPSALLKYCASLMFYSVQSNKSNNLDFVTGVYTLPAGQLPDFVSKVCVLPALYDK